MKYLWVLLALSACGGGGDSEDYPDPDADCYKTVVFKNHNDLEEFKSLGGCSRVLVTGTQFIE